MDILIDGILLIMKNINSPDLNNIIPPIYITEKIVGPKRFRYKEVLLYIYFDSTKLYYTIYISSHHLGIITTNYI